MNVVIVEPIKMLKQMEIKEIIEAAREKLDIERLKPMQERMLDSESPRVELSAPTGSGKTLAFACYVARRLKRSGEGVQAVVIVPSRELAVQTGDTVRRIAQGYKTVVMYGGHRMEDEQKSLFPLPDILVSTPGRLLDHLRRGTLEIKNPVTLVLDEYDKSLELGFEKEMREIARRIGEPRNVVLTSATPLRTALPEWLGRSSFELYDYSSEDRPEIETVHIESPTKDKAETLADLLMALPRGTKTVVFVNHRESADRLYNFLKKQHIAVGLYHGGLDQHEREKALTLFENRTTPVLVATDLAGRGLDISGIDSVVHYHIPATAENWIHRNGRTARNGAGGTVYVITSEGEGIPDYVSWEREWLSVLRHENASLLSERATLHINAGKKEKISKGDIVGYLISRGGVESSEIGPIKLMDHEAMVSVPREKAREIIERTAPYKLKNKKIRITQVKI